MAERYKLSICGTELSIFADDSEEYVRTLSEELTEKFNSLMLNNARCTKIEALLLLSLDILDDKKKLEAETIRLEKENEFLRKRIK